ncbi:MAG: ribosome maturation factor RimM, partial [Betaproteobacteria bacterium]
PVLLRIVQAREQGDAIVATAQELDDRDLAESLKGARIFVPRTSFPTPDEGEFYWVDLIGAHVTNRRGVVLGTVKALASNGAQDLLQVEAADGAGPAILVPMVERYVEAVDLAAREVRVDWEPDW